MAREKYKDLKFSEDAQLLINGANAIVASYQEQGLRLTVRQLYYQFVTKNWIVNSEKSYKSLTDLISRARLAGLVDWDAIEDRNREAVQSPEFSSLSAALDSALSSFRLKRWDDQSNYVELWVEKAALAGVLWPIASKYHVVLMVNKGYSSQSAMYESAQRFRRRCLRKDKPLRTPHLLYLGDFDPSGEDMVRDISERMAMFKMPVNVQKVGLTMAQIEHFKPPPNPAKVTDPRAKAYIEKWGPTSWEVDALPPVELTRVVSKAILRLLDVPRMKAVKAQEEVLKAKLTAALAEIK